MQPNREVLPHHYRYSGTPDDLFGANLTFENGVDLAGGGYGIYVQNGQTYHQFIQDTSRPLNGCVTVGEVTTCVNPGHEHTDWTTDYDAGNMDGFCHQYANSGQCPSYSYVPQSEVQPYFDIASYYGFANYFFQTNEGPSYEAHQFLFSGTSTGVSPGQTNSQYFVSSLPNKDINGNVSCPYIGTDFPNWVNTNGVGVGSLLSSECYPHDTLVTNSGGDKGVSWGYYTQSRPAIWDAPEALSEVCQQVTNNSCTGTEWTTHVHVADEGGYSDAPIFDDLYKCTLPAISWVTPDKRYSDHATEDNTGLGPSFVGDIVDAVGGGMAGSSCNQPSATNALYWKQEPTAIFILWDDWGGWFDHVAPWAVYRDPADPTQCPSTVAPNGWGCGYTSGFRVPLLVVSPYTLAGTISGKCGVTGYPNCPNPGTNNVYVHDFGSILAFTEKNFGLNFIDQSGDLGYADYNAPDWSSDHSSHVPLSDFFGSTYYNFASINTSEPYTCFQNFGTCTNTTYVPDGPDGDDGD
jgi:hypothetical protein